MRHSLVAYCSQMKTESNEKTYTPANAPARRKMAHRAPSAERSETYVLAHDKVTRRRVDNEELDVKEIDRTPPDDLEVSIFINFNDKTREMKFSRRRSRVSCRIDESEVSRLKLAAPGRSFPTTDYVIYSSGAPPYAARANPRRCVGDARMHVDTTRRTFC